MIIAGTTFPKARIDFSQRQTKKQARFVGGDGSVTARDLQDFDERFINYVMPRVTNADKETFEALIAGANVNFAATAISITDDYGSTFNARIWSQSITYTHRLNRWWEIKFQVRKEV